MKLPSSKSFDEGYNTTVALDQQTAVGGKGGIAFDSGCNLSGLRKVHIHCGPFYHEGVDTYDSTIKRIFLEFDKPFHLKDARGEPSYNGCGIGMNKDRDTQSIFELNPSDSIVRIDVWNDGFVVNAIRFFMKSGAISQLTECQSIQPSQLLPSKENNLVRN